MFSVQQFYNERGVVCVCVFVCLFVCLCVSNRNYSSHILGNVSPSKIVAVLPHHVLQSKQL
jgi:hypothetical protein